jgi:hypothetical protein
MLLQSGSTHELMLLPCLDGPLSVTLGQLAR